ncbi:hypothetical protein EMIT0111MI5_50121 [Burkholderia sp. IT-111MI5]
MTGRAPSLPSHALSSAEPTAIANAASISAASATCPIHKLSNFIARTLPETAGRRRGGNGTDSGNEATARYKTSLMNPETGEMTGPAAEAAPRDPRVYGLRW